MKVLVLTVFLSAGGGLRAGAAHAQGAAAPAGLSAKAPAADGAFSGKENHYFFCEWRGVPSQRDSAPQNRSFDRVFSYEKSSEGFRASFIEKSDRPVKEKSGFLYREFPAGPTGFQAKQRKVFYIYRFHRETQILTRSVVSYLPPEDYEKRLEEERSNPYIIPCAPPESPFSDLWRDMDKEAPPHYKKCGFDKSEWRCQKTSRLKYFWLWILLEVRRALSV